MVLSRHIRLSRDQAIRESQDTRLNVHLWILTFNPESGLDTMPRSTWAGDWVGEAGFFVEILGNRDSRSSLEPGGLNAERIRVSLSGERTPVPEGRLVDRPWGPVVLCPHSGQGAKAVLHLGIGSDHDVGIDRSVKRVSKQAQGCGASDRQEALPSDLTRGDRKTGEAHGQDQPMTVLLQ